MKVIVALCIVLFILLALKESTSHTTQVCARVDQCTGELFLAIGTYHTVSGTAQGNLVLSSQNGLVADQIIPLNSLVPVSPSALNTPPAGFSSGDCGACSGGYGGQNLNTHALASFTNLPADTYNIDVSGTDFNFDPTGSGAGCVPSNVDIPSPSTVFVDCPGPVTVALDNSCGGTIPINTPTCFVDPILCPTTTCSVDADPGNISSFSTAGTFTNSWEILVNGGFRTGITCTQTVTVQDSSLPTITCPSDITFPDTNIAIPLPTTNDNCGVQSYSNDYTGVQDASASYPLGTTTVTYTVSDVNGNSDSCSFDVTVIDLCQSSINVDLLSENSFTHSVIPEDILLDFSVSNITLTTSGTFNYGDFLSQEMDGIVHSVTVSALHGITPLTCDTQVVLTASQPDLTVCSNNFITTPVMYENKAMYRGFMYNWPTNIGLDDDKYEFTFAVYSEDQSYHHYDFESGVKANSGSYYWIGFHNLIPFYNYQITILITNTDTGSVYGPFCSTILYLTTH